jgi:hypothetical protein
MINDAEVIIADIETSNGVIHVIDADLLPPAEPTALPVSGGAPNYSVFLILLAVGALLAINGLVLSTRTVLADQ